MIAEFVFGILATTIVMWFSCWRYRPTGGAELAGRRNMINALKRLQASQGKPAYRTNWQRLRLTRGGCKPSSRAIRHWRSGLKPFSRTPQSSRPDRPTYA